MATGDLRPRGAYPSDPSTGATGSSVTRITSVPTPPSRPAPRWLPYALVGAVVALNILGFVTNASAPKLLKDHPLTLMILNPRYRYMVVAAPRVDALPFYLIGVARLLFSDPIYFLLGWFYGDRAIAYFNDVAGEQTVESTRRFFLKASAVMALFFAGPIICVLAGAAKMKPRLFFTLDVVGTIIVVSLLRLFSDAMGDFIKSFLRFNDRNYKWLMVLTVASTLLVLLRVGGRRMKAARSFADDAADGSDPD